MSPAKRAAFTKPWGSIVKLSMLGQSEANRVGQGWRSQRQGHVTAPLGQQKRLSFAPIFSMWSNWKSHVPVVQWRKRPKADLIIGLGCSEKGASADKRKGAMAVVVKKHLVQET